MKKLSILAMALIMLTANSLVNAQKYYNSSDNISGISVFVSSMLFAAVANVSYDHLYPVKKKTHIGFTTGLTAQAYAPEGLSYGGHLTFTMLTGSARRRFEMKLGLSYTPITWVNYHNKRFVFYHDYLSLIPVISIGMNTQSSKNRSFRRIAISTAGLGFGYGFRF